MCIAKPTDIELFLQGGKAEFTLKSNRTGAHRTYKTRPMPNSKACFVSYLGGGDNTGDFRYLGILSENLFLHHTKASPAKATSVFKGLDWFLRTLKKRGEKLSQVEFYHSGRCGRCGRKLTTPESIETGMGPICRSKLQ